MVLCCGLIKSQACDIMFAALQNMQNQDLTILVALTADPLTC